MKKLMTIFGAVMFASLTNFYFAQNLSTVNELLQGKWQAVDDKTNFLVFDKNERKEISKGMTKWDVELFSLSDKCLNESEKDESGFEVETDKYMSCKQSDLCWYIERVTEDELVLIYMGRGNTLAYKRIK